MGPVQSSVGSAEEQRRRRGKEWNRDKQSACAIVGVQQAIIVMAAPRLPCCPPAVDVSMEWRLTLRSGGEISGSTPMNGRTRSRTAV